MNLRPDRRRRKTGHPLAGLNACLLAHLTAADVERLAREPSAGNRVDTARKLATEFAQGLAGPKERRLAEEVFDILACDVEARVRQALSENLKSCPFIPHQLAQVLAKDIDEVALPIITHSEVLTDEDLVDLIETGGTAKQMAIADRGRLSAQVTDALIATDKQIVVERVIQNEGAEIAEQAFHRVIANFASQDSVMAVMVARRRLPLAVVDRLVSKISGALRDQLIVNHRLPAGLTGNLVEHSQAAVLANYAAEEEDTAEIQALVNRLHEEEGLTIGFLLRGLFNCDLRLFETAMAALADVSTDYARFLIRDRNVAGLRLLYDRSRLPQRYFKAFEVGVLAARQAAAEGFNSKRHRQWILDGLSAAYGNVSRDGIIQALFELERANESYEDERSLIRL